MGKKYWPVLFAICGGFLLASCQSPAPATPTPLSVPDVVATMIAEATRGAPGLPTQEVAPTQAASPSLPTLAVTVPSTPAPVAVETQAVASAPGDCTAQARFVQDVSVPDLEWIEPGAGFVKTWRLLNTGTCAWNSDYKLVFQAGDAMSAETSLALPVVQPAATVDVSVPMTAPVNGGVYTSFWRIVNGQGATVALAGADTPRIWVTIQVPVRVAAALEDVPVTGPLDTLANTQPTAAAANPTASPGNNPANTPGANPTPAAVSPVCPSKLDIAYTQRLIALINAERTNRGLPALRVNEQLTLAALDHSMDMTCNNFVEHYGTDGSTWFTRIKARGYAYTSAYENVAAGNPAVGGSPEWVIQVLWMNSQVHRENILNPNVTDIGVGFLTNPSAQYVGYTTVNFAKP
jgi:uncharacterized protein YkwD